MAVLYVSLYSSKRFEYSFEDKLVEGLQRNKKKFTSLHTKDNGLSGSFSISSYYLSSMCISQLS